MPDFLRSAWYVLGWRDDITERPLRRMVIGEPLVAYRLADGTSIALSDICAHRYAPLSRGLLVGDDIQCPYHGLRFDRAGSCTFSPHGATPRASIRSYPAIDRYGLVWVWMGEPSLADAGRIPDLTGLDVLAQGAVRGAMEVKANYELIADNLLDLSHVPFLHAQLRVPNASVVERHEVRQDGETVWSMRWRDGALPNALQALFWPSDKIGAARAHMRWDAPGILWLDVGISTPEAPSEADVSIPSAHLLTPETEDRTRYYWAFLRDRRTDDDEISRIIRKIGEQAFYEEDRPMIEAQQENISMMSDASALNRALSPADSAAARARLVLRRRIAADSRDCDADREF